MHHRVRGAALISFGLVALLLAWSGASGPPARAGADQIAVRPSTERTLRLPETPYRYADIELPAHFKTAAARRFDNTPADNPMTDAGRRLGESFFTTRVYRPTTRWPAAPATCRAAPSWIRIALAKALKASSRSATP